MAERAGLGLESRWAGWNEDEYGPDSINHISVYRRLS